MFAASDLVGVKPIRAVSGLRGFNDAPRPFGAELLVSPITPHWVL